MFYSTQQLNTAVTICLFIILFNQHFINPYKYLQTTVYTYLYLSTQYNVLRRYTWSYYGNER